MAISSSSNYLYPSFSNEMVQSVTPVTLSQIQPANEVEFLGESKKNCKRKRETKDDQTQNQESNTKNRSLDAKIDLLHKQIKTIQSKKVIPLKPLIIEIKNETNQQEKFLRETLEANGKLKEEALKNSKDKQNLQDQIDVLKQQNQYADFLRSQYDNLLPPVEQPFGDNSQHGVVDFNSSNISPLVSINQNLGEDLESGLTLIEDIAKLQQLVQNLSKGKENAFSQQLAKISNLAVSQYNYLNSAKIVVKQLSTASRNLSNDERVNQLNTRVEALQRENEQLKRNLVLFQKANELNYQNNIKNIQQYERMIGLDTKHLQQRILCYPVLPNNTLMSNDVFADQ